MTIDQFTQRIGDLGRQLSDLDTAILKATSEPLSRIKAGAPRDTGALQQSIQLVIDSPKSFYLEMLAYGFFQNYGVKASDDSKTVTRTNQRPVEEQAKFGLPPRNDSTYYKFGTRQTGKKPWGAFYSGLDAQGFFNMAELERVITQNLQTELNNIVE